MMRHLIKGSMIALAFPPVFMVFSFSLATVPAWVALVSAASLVSVYVGLAFVPVRTVQERRFAMGIAALAMGIEVIYGVLHSMQVQAPEMFVSPPLWATISMGILHGAPFSLLLFSVSLLVVHSEQRSGYMDNEERTATVLTEAIEILAQQREMLAEQEQHMLALPREAQIAPKTHRPTPYKCQECGAALTQQEYASSRRWGKCRHCKELQEREQMSAEEMEE